MAFYQLLGTDMALRPNVRRNLAESKERKVELILYGGKVICRCVERDTFAFKIFVTIFVR